MNPTRRTRRLSLTLAALAAALALPACPATLASAAGPAAQAPAWVLPAPLYAPLTSDTSFTEKSGDVVFAQITVTLHAGEKRRVFGRLEATANHTPGEWLATAVRCMDSTGGQSGVAAWPGTNHEGTKGAYTPPGHLVLSPSLLFTAPTAGTYHCQLIAYTSSNGDPPPSSDYQVTALKADLSGYGGTWLKVSSSDEAGAQWWQNPPCDSNGKWATCKYLGVSQELQIFQNDGTPLQMWQAAANATAASVNATVEVTVCDHNTSSCPANHQGTSAGSTVLTHLELDQLNPGGDICQRNQTQDQTYPLDDTGHHYSLSYQLTNAPISATCGGSRLFAMYVYIKDVAGNPIKIDGARCDTDDEMYCVKHPEAQTEAQTDAYAFNSTFYTTVHVPNVLGSSQAAATQAITAADLSVGTISDVVNPAPAGTVISQNSPGGTVEPIGSPVNLTVSLGAATVPDVTGLTQSPAVAQIHAAGLTVGAIAHPNTCIDPGIVQTQHPAPGTTVAPGSAVNITIPTCNGPPQ
jgi:hypothetical protein